MLESEELISGSSLTISDTHGARFRAGWVDAPGATVNAYVDDVAVNDSTGSYENSWPGQGRVVLSSAVWSSWTASTSTDCGGVAPSTTFATDGGVNMANALNNTPPVGQADHSTAGHTSDPHQTRSTSTATVRVFGKAFSMLGAIGDLYVGALNTTISSIGANLTGQTSDGDVVAQSFYLNGTLESFAVRMTKSGSPADDLIIELVEDNAGVPTGTVIQTWTIPGASAPGGTTLTLTLDNPVPCYRTLWVRMSRSGANDSANFYRWYADAFTFAGGFVAARRRSGTWANAYVNHDLQLYSSQGFRPPKVITGWICHGEAIATGTKTYSTYVTLGNVIPTAVTGNVGNDAGAAGTYPTLWTWTSTASIYRQPMNTSGGMSCVGPMIQITLTSAGRFSLLCFAGAYVELDEVYTGDWTRLQKTSDSSIWWGKQAVATTTYECGTDGLTIRTVSPGQWLLYPDPQIAAGDNFPTTSVVVTDETLASSYTFA
jgi:hypothetical protein